MNIHYDDIYARSYIKRYDPAFFNDKEYAYDQMKEWLREVGSFPYIRKAFETLDFDDDVDILSYTLVQPINDAADEDFVKKIFSDGFVICWMRPQVDSIINSSVTIGGNQEKRLLSNYKPNQERLKELEVQLKKYIRDYGYVNGTYGSES